MKVEIVFTGVIALVMGGPIPTLDDPDFKAVETTPVDAYLLKATDHVPELLIHKDYVGNRAGTGSCLQGNAPCAKWDPVNGSYERGACDAAAGYDYFIWCLEDMQIVIMQSSDEVAKFFNGSRPRGGHKRHLEYTYPDEESPGKPDERDVTWIPEMAKITGRDGGKLKTQINAAVVSAMEGLRGEMSGEVPASASTWSWCEWTKAGKPCKAISGRAYDQRFASEVLFTLEVLTPQFFLLPRTGTASPPVIIQLDSKSKKDKTIRVFNIMQPALDALTDGKVDGRDVCVAPHFLHYLQVASKASRQRPYKEGPCASFGTSPDVFCPPVVFWRP